MDQRLYTCLERLARLGSPEGTTTEKAAEVVAGVREQLAGTGGDAGDRVLASTKHLLGCVDPSVQDDVRLECGCLAVVLLHRTSELLEASEEPSPPTPKAGGRRGVDPEAPPPPANLLSLQQTQVLAAAARVALYTVVLAGLDQEAARYLRMTLARAKFVLGPAPLEVPEGSRHPLLAATMRLLLSVVKHDTVGAGIRQSVFPEVLSALLCLCFCPATSKRHPEDTGYFRGQLESLTAAVEPSVTLKHLLLLMGLTQGGASGSSRSNVGRGGGGGGQGWLGRTCNSLVVRRYLMSEGGGGARAGGGLRAVVGAGLALCDGQDSRRCQAVAALIAHARTPDLDQFYAALGPQVIEMLDRASQLAPEVVRVVVLLAGELAERCPSLAAQHLGGPLLQPLTCTTSPSAPQECVGTSLTECVIRLHSVLVEAAPPTPALARLLQPALCPLLALAALPTTHLRSPSRHLLGRYLSHLSEEEVVDTLLGLAGLTPLTLSPPVFPDVTLVLDGTGGVVVEACSKPPDTLEEDEARASCLSAILEDLGHPSVILAFYKKLVEFLDFQGEEKSATRSGPPIVCLRTEADEVACQFEQARRVAVCAGLLSCLAESEKLTGDLFQDLSAAGPVVGGLLQAGCQECRDEGLRDIQVSLTANVLVLVTCYVSDRSLRGEMTSRDWTGLKALLPVLKQTEECLEDEGVRLMATQLRSMVATHGVVCTEAASADTTQANPEKKGKGKVEKRLEKVGGGKLSSDTSQQPEGTRAATPIVKDMKTSTTQIKDDRNKVKVETKETGKDALIKTECEKEIPKQALEEKIKAGKGDDGSTAKEIKEEKEETEKTNIMATKETPRKAETESSAFRSAMEDLMSPLLPVRGHGILALAKLLEAKDEEALEHGTQLLALFQHHLREEDSYLYLMAVRGLAALCDVLPEKAVVVLTKEFSVGRRSTEDRAKLAESLSRATRRLGPLLPHYRNHFINAFLTGVRDPEWLVRAASLSALGDVCKELRFSLGPIVNEVFSVLYDAVAQDESHEVRRAAVLVVTLLLQGLGGDALKVLNDVVRDMYRVLRRLEASDPDPVVRLHAQLALQEVDSIMRRFLLPSTGLTKRIYVLDPPPSAL